MGKSKLDHPGLDSEGKRLFFFIGITLADKYKKKWFRPLDTITLYYVFIMLSTFKTMLPMREATFFLRVK